MTEGKINDFIATPVDLGTKSDYELLLTSLNMRAARASADLRRPDGSPPISNDQWRTMKLQKEWVRRATQARLPSDEDAERLHHILSFLRTLPRTDARLYIGWVIKSRKSAAVAFANTQAKGASKKKGQ